MTDLSHLDEFILALNKGQKLLDRNQASIKHHELMQRYDKALTNLITLWGELKGHGMVKKGGKS